MIPLRALHFTGTGATLSERMATTGVDQVGGDEGWEDGLQREATTSWRPGIQPREPANHSGTFASRNCLNENDESARYSVALPQSGEDTIPHQVIGFLSNFLKRR